MRRLLVVLCMAGLGSTLSLQKDEDSQRTAPIEAQARDGGSHGHGSHGGGHSGVSSYTSISSSSHGSSHGDGHGSSHGSSSGGYAPAVSSSYGGTAHSAQPNSYGGGSTGNLYYYYYPVQEQHHKYPVHHSNGGGGGGGGLGLLGTLGSIVLPIVVIGGILLLIASVVGMIYTNNNKRSNDDSPTLEKITEWRSELERVFYMYIDVLESEECIPRTLCELGAYGRSYEFPGKETLLSLAENYLPKSMQSNARVLKKAVTGVYNKNQCMKLFKCEPPTSLS